MAQSQMKAPLHFGAWAEKTCPYTPTCDGIGLVQTYSNTAASDYSSAYVYVAGEFVGNPSCHYGAKDAVVFPVKAGEEVTTAWYQTSGSIKFKFMPIEGG